MNFSLKVLWVEQEHHGGERISEVARRVLQESQWVVRETKGPLVVMTAEIQLCSLL